jgi:hypothetical protein
MSNKNHANGTDRAAIFARLWEAKDGHMPRLLARMVLKLGFHSRDKTRMHELSVKNQEGPFPQQSWKSSTISSRLGT